MTPTGGRSRKSVRSPRRSRSRRRRVLIRSVCRPRHSENAADGADEEVRSGQIQAGSGFQYWLLKFDGVENNRDKELADPRGYGAIEYAYSMMARAAGIEVAEARLLEESVDLIGG